MTNSNCKLVLLKDWVIKLIKYNNISEDKAASYKQSWALAYKFADELESELGISKKILARMIQGAVYHYHKERGENLTHGIINKHLQENEPCPDHYKSALKIDKNIKNNKTAILENKERQLPEKRESFSSSNKQNLKNFNRIDQFYDSDQKRMKDLFFDELIDFLPEEHKEKLRWFLNNKGKIIPWVDIKKNEMATQVKGIFKPADWEYTLSVKNTQGENYNDSDLYLSNNNAWMLYYCPENDSQKGFEVYTNKSLLNNFIDLVPIGYLHQVRQKPGAAYRVMGPALVRYEKSINRFHLNGFDDDNKISNYLINDRIN